KRRAIKHVTEQGLGNTTQSCRALGLAISSYYSQSKVSVENRKMQRAIVDLSQAHPRYGYRRITALLQRKGHEVNVKRVQRGRRMEGLQVKKSSDSCGASVFPQRSGNAPVNHVWSWDFEEDQTENGTRFRILSLIDEHTRECLALHVA